WHRKAECVGSRQALNPSHLREWGSSMRYFLAFVFLAFLCAIGVCAIQTRDVITVTFLTWNVSQPVAMVMVVVYVLGMLSGWSVVGFLRRSYRGATATPHQCPAVCRCSRRMPAVSSS